MTQATAEKRCTICGEVKPLYAFYKNHQNSDGHQSQCRPCAKAYLKKWESEHREERNAERRPYRRKGAPKRQHRRKSPPEKRSTRIKREYGITMEQYDEMLKAQDNVCAICGSEETYVRYGVVGKLAIDHDHETGQVRGLLCSRCNSGIGLLGDDPERAQAAVDYLMEHRKDYS